MNGKSIRIVGVNAAGITSKLDSFDKLIFDRRPSIWMMQETKRRVTDKQIQTKNLVNYQVFEMKRGKTKEEGGKGSNGGGLAIGVLHDINPVLVRQGDDEIECMTIEVTTGTTRLRCVTGYGPQESDCVSRKEKFWNYLEIEVHSAQEDGIGLIIEIDSNAWAGEQVIPGDPKTQNNNGKHLSQFLERNTNVTLVNALPICQGAITRKRKTDCLDEKSILDLFIVCDRILPFVTKMHVDVQGENQLTNFRGISKRGRVTESDHAKIEIDVDLQYEVKKPQRVEAYNFKNVECQKVFKEITTTTNLFSTCFESGELFQDQIKKWEHVLKSHVVTAFPKIRSRKRKFCETDIGQMLEERKKLKLDKNPNLIKIASLEKIIATKSSEDYVNKIRETMGHLKGDDGGVSHHGVWKARNMVISNDKESRPIALYDKSGNLITNSEGIKNLCLEEILERVRHRKIHPNLEELQKLKEILCQKRLDLAKHIKSKPWSLEDLEKVLQQLKKKKCGY